MTVEVDTAGPADARYSSTRFTCNVSGVASWVYSFTGDAHAATRDWANGATVDLNWLKFGTDEETVAVEIALADLSDVTSFAVYPKHLDTMAGIVEVPGEPAILTLQVPMTKRLRVEINGGGLNILYIQTQPLKATLPTPRVDWTTLTNTVTFDSSNEQVTFSAPHNLSEDQKIAFKLGSGAALPVGLEEGFTYAVAIVDTTKVTLKNSEGEGIDLADNGSGTITAGPNFYAGTDALYFPAGRHVVGYDFLIGSSDLTLYFDVGAVVVGTFNLQNFDDVLFDGPGGISGEYTTYEFVHALSVADQFRHRTFHHTGVTDRCSVRGVTVFNTPKQAAVNFTISSFRNVSVISPLNANTGGAFNARRKSVADLNSEVIDCFAFVADDAIHMIYNPIALSRTVTGTFIICAVGCPLLFDYYGVFERDQDFGSTTVSDVDLMQLYDGNNPTQFGSVIRSWMDNYAADAGKGVFDYSLSDVRVWGPISGRLDQLMFSVVLMSSRKVVP
jgi:hypothetical protein